MRVETLLVSSLMHRRTILVTAVPYEGQSIVIVTLTDSPPAPPPSRFLPPSPVVMSCLLGCGVAGRLVVG